MLRRGVEVCVGTPGRLNDCLESHLMVLNQCVYVVLDEADRMIDMGFEPQVNSILDAIGLKLKSENEEVAWMQEDQVSKKGAASLGIRITAMFSATMPPEVEKLAKTFLRHPAIVAIGDTEGVKNKRIEQRIMWTTAGAKKNELIKILKSSTLTDDAKTIVFVNEKKACNLISKAIEQAGFHPTTLHGGKKQDEREIALREFKEGIRDVLVATDVAGRGIDIPDVTHVINFDMPDKIDKYCHRIGRTGRAGKDGLSSTLLCEDDSEVFYELKKYLTDTQQAVPHQLASHASAKVAPGTRNDRGEIMGQRRDKVQFAK